jgi:hypothetical protein
MLFGDHMPDDGSIMQDSASARHGELSYLGGNIECLTPS